MNDARYTQHRLFPRRADLLPTQLGNALRSGEERAGGRYGLDTVVVWPRLYPLLSDSVRALVDDERNQLDVAARFTVVSLLAAAISFGLLLTHGWWLLVPAGCCVLAWLSYRGAISAAVAYGIGLETAFDLHRTDLLRALWLPTPPEPEDEWTLNNLLSQFFLEAPLAPHAAKDRARPSQSKPMADSGPSERTPRRA
jgi:hypothetical protein